MRNRVLTDQNNVFSQQWQEAIEMAKSKIVLAQARQKKYYDRSVKECSFKRNDIVLLKIMSVQTGKFYMRWDGPFIVIKKLSDVNYNISHLDDNYQIVVHVNRLRKWNGDPKSLNKTISLEDVNPQIQTAAPTVTKSRSENKIVSETESESESESESEKENESEKQNENEITVDIHVPNPLPTNVEEDITPTQSAEAAISETENTTTNPTANNNKQHATVEQPQTAAAQKTRKVGRPRKNQRPPKPDIQPSTHKFKLRPTTRLPSKF
jgi:hypothetical protein